MLNYYPINSVFSWEKRPACSKTNSPSLTQPCVYVAVNFLSQVIFSFVSTSLAYILTTKEKIKNKKKLPEIMIDNFILSTKRGKPLRISCNVFPIYFYPKPLLVATDKSRRSLLKHSLGYIKRISCVSNLFFYAINYSEKNPCFWKHFKER